MNDKLHWISLWTPLVLVGGIVAAMGCTHPLSTSEPQSQPENTCIAVQLQSPRFAPVWAITLRNQYKVAQGYRTALRTAPTPAARLAFEQRYTRVAIEYNRMAKEAPPLAFETLTQPRVLPE